MLSKFKLVYHIYLKKVAALTDHVFKCRAGRIEPRPIRIRITSMWEEIVGFSWPRYISMVIDSFGIATWSRVKQIELATRLLQFIVISIIKNIIYII